MAAEPACKSEDLNELKAHKMTRVGVEKASVYLSNKHSGLWDHLAHVLPLHL